jgi:hypothetical protein
MDTHSSYSKGTRAFKALWEGENGDCLRAIFDDAFEFHNLDGRNDVTDLKGLRQRVAELHAAHPGARLRIENAFGSGSHYAFDWALSDASSGDAPYRQKTSGSSIRNGSVMVRLSGDHVAELWELNGALDG